MFNNIKNFYLNFKLQHPSARGVSIKSVYQNLGGYWFNSITTMENKINNFLVDLEFFLNFNLTTHYLLFISIFLFLILFFFILVVVSMDRDREARILLKFKLNNKIVIIPFFSFYIDTTGISDSIKKNAILIYSAVLSFFLIFLNLFLVSLEIFLEEESFTNHLHTFTDNNLFLLNDGVEDSVLNYLSNNNSSNLINDYFSSNKNLVTNNNSFIFKFENMYNSLSASGINDIVNSTSSLDADKYSIMNFVQTDVIKAKEELEQLQQLKLKFKLLNDIDNLEFTNFYSQYAELLKLKETFVSNYELFAEQLFSNKYKGHDGNFNKFVSSFKFNNLYVKDVLPFILYKDIDFMSNSYTAYLYDQSISTTVYKEYAKAYSELYSLGIQTEFRRINFIDRFLLPEVQNDLDFSRYVANKYFLSNTQIYLDNTYTMTAYFYNSLHEFTAFNLKTLTNFTNIDYDVVRFLYTGKGEKVYRICGIRYLYFYKLFNLL